MKDALKHLALIAASNVGLMTGNFGEKLEPKSFVQHEVQGTHKFRTKKPKKVTSNKRHRRQYLCGKPAFRLAR